MAWCRGSLELIEQRTAALGGAQCKRANAEQCSEDRCSNQRAGSQKRGVLDAWHRGMLLGGADLYAVAYVACDPFAEPEIQRHRTATEM